MQLFIFVLAILFSLNGEASSVFRGLRTCFDVLTGRGSVTPEELNERIAPVLGRLKDERVHAEDRMRTYIKLREVAEADALVAKAASVMMAESFYDFVGRPDFFNKMMFSWSRWSTVEGRDSLLTTAPKALRTYRSLAHAQMIFNLSTEHGFSDATKDYLASLSPTLLGRVILDQVPQIKTEKSHEHSRRVEIPLKALILQRQHFNTFAKLAKQDPEHFGNQPLIERLGLLLGAANPRRSPDTLVEIVNLIGYLKLNPKLFKKAEYLETLQNVSPDARERLQGYYPALEPALNVEALSQDGLNAYQYARTSRDIVQLL